SEVGTEHIGDRERAVGQLILFEDDRQTTRGRNRRGVERVGNQFSGPPGLAEADPQAPRLVVRAVRAAHDLSERLLTREPSLDVVLLRRYGTEIPGAHVHDPVRHAELPEHLLGVGPQLLQDGRRVLRSTEDELLHLLELVDPENPLLVDSVPPDLLSEAGAHTGEADGKTVLVED